MKDINFIKPVFDLMQTSMHIVDRDCKLHLNNGRINCNDCVYNVMRQDGSYECLKEMLLDITLYYETIKEEYK